MDLFSNEKNIKLLQNLLNPKDDDGSSDSEPDERVPIAAKYSPADLVKSTPSTSYSIENRRPYNKPNQPQTVDEWEEQEALLTANELDQRPSPEYRIIYKQAVTPEDIYLQMAAKTSATASCEEMCIEISMPDEIVEIDRMQLDVASDSIELQTSIYHLKLPLVQPIDPDRGKAMWDNENKTLKLTLRMKREYDFVNF